MSTHTLSPRVWVSAHRFVQGHPRGLAVAGLTLNLAGVVLLFLFGMPFRIPTHGGIPIVSDVPRAEQRAMLATDAFYFWIGVGGLAFIIVGTLLQVAAVLGAYDRR
jgi:hypothetical protein